MSISKPVLVLPAIRTQTDAPAQEASAPAKPAEEARNEFTSIVFYCTKNFWLGVSSVVSSLIFRVVYAGLVCRCLLNQKGCCAFWTWKDFPTAKPFRRSTLYMARIDGKKCWEHLAFYQILQLALVPLELKHEFLTCIQTKVVAIVAGIVPIVSNCDSCYSPIVCSRYSWLYPNKVGWCDCRRLWSGQWTNSRRRDSAGKDQLRHSTWSLFQHYSEIVYIYIYMD